MVQAIQSRVQVVAGQMGGPPVPPEHTSQFTVNALGRLADVAQFSDIIVKSPRGESANIVRVRDVARVELGRRVLAPLPPSAATQRPKSWFFPCPAPMP